MARNESRAIAGYYPFPPGLLPALASLVSPVSKASAWSNLQPLQVLDPCSGGAEAVLGMLSAWRHWSPAKAELWRDKKSAPEKRSPQFVLTTIELDHSRHDIARTNLETAAANGVISTESGALPGDASRWTRRSSTGLATDRWCHILYLNPPYDTHPVHRREEAAWLLRWLPQVVDGGILIAVFPAAAMDACADILASHTRDRGIIIQRLPLPEFEAFKQLVIVGKVSAVGIPQPARAEVLRSYGEFPEDLPPVLQLEEKPLVEGPPVRYSPGTWTYRAVRPEDVAPLIRPLERVRGISARIDEMVGHRVELAMPPRPSHIVMALVDGAFDGQVIRSPRAGLPPVLVKAVSGRQLLTVSQEERLNKDDEPEVVTKLVEVPSLRLHVMNMVSYEFLEPAPASLPSGATALDQMNIADFVLAYAEPLAELMSQLFVPLHGMRDEDLVELPPFARKLFPAQHHAVTAALRLFCRQRAALLMAEIGTGKTSMATQIFGALRPSAAMDVLGPAATFEPRHKTILSLEALGEDPRRLPVAERMLVMAPPHLVYSWTKEVLASLPTARVVEVVQISDLQLPADVYVLSRERAKLSHGWRGVGAGFLAPGLPGGATLSRQLPKKMTCPKCGRAVEIPGWRRRRPPGPEDLADGRVVCLHWPLPRAPLWRAVDFLAQTLAKWSPVGSAGSWAAHRHPNLGLRLEILRAREAAAAKAAGRDEVPSLEEVVPKLGGGMRTLSAAIKVCLRAIGGTLAAYPVGGWQLEAPELGAMLLALGRAAVAAGWQVPEYRGEVLRYVFGVDVDETRQKFRKLDDKLSSWRNQVMGVLSRDYDYQAVGSPLAMWNQIWLQLYEVATKASGPPAEMCGERLYGAEPKPRRYSIARWMARYVPAAWWSTTMLVIDEAHEMSNGETAQSLAGQRLANRAGSTLLLTGSVMSGYARSLFHVLRLASTEFAQEWRHADEGRFVAAYGYSKFREVSDPLKARPKRKGRQSDRRETTTMVRTGDAPGVAPGAVLRHVLPVAAVVHQEDLELDIPPMFEHEVQVTTDERDLEMLNEWERVEFALIEAMADISIRRKLLWAMLKVPTYPDLGCEDVGPFVIQMPIDRDEPEAPRPIIVEAVLQPADYVTPKERWLLQFLVEQREQGRRSLVFVTHTGGGYPTRLQRLLGAHGASCAYLDVKKVPAKSRDQWIEERCGEVEVLICNPNAVRTGLNSLVAFSNAVWMEADYDARTYRQANGRIHRIGQALEAHVYYLYLPGSSQEDAKKLIAAKVDASLRVDGLDVASSLAMAGASEDDKAAAAVYNDVAQMIYERTVARRRA